MKHKQGVKFLKELKSNLSRVLCLYIALYQAERHINRTHSWVSICEAVSFLVEHFSIVFASCKASSSPRSLAAHDRVGWNDLRMCCISSLSSLGKQQEFSRIALQP